MTVADTAAAMQVSERTVKRDWAMAQAWLYRDWVVKAGEQPLIQSATAKLMANM